MSRTRRLLVVAAAWAAPVAWTAVALLSGPSDGTLVSPSGAMSGAHRWDESLTVVRTYGDTPLRSGDVVTAVDGTPVTQWVTDDRRADRRIGESVTYDVTRPGADLATRLRIQVPLRRYPLADAAAANVGPMVLVLLPLATASLVFWRRPRAPETWALLLAGSLLPLLVTSWPFGLGVVDLTGGRGVSPHVVGETAGAAAVGAALLATVLLLPADTIPGRRAAALALALVVPGLGYAVWVGAVALRLEPAAARLQGLVTVAGPALATTAPVALLLLARGVVRARSREDRLAVRLVLLALLGALGARLLLVDVPDRLLGSPLLPGDLLGLLLAPAALGCVAAAVLRYRLEEIEPTVRRTLVQAAVATAVGAAFVAAVSAVNLASDTSFRAMVAGGAVAVLLLPLAVALNRWIRRVVYGDPAAAQQVVAELRRLDPLTAPADALRDTLTLLARRLRLSWASIEVYGDRPADRIETFIGEPGGTTTVVDLVVGGSPVGRLTLAAAADRDPFGPADRRLLEDVGAQVGALVQAMAINRDLQRSRHAIVTAREEERLRVRRDLHDGLGPSLATFAMRLEAARDLIAEDPARAEDLVGRLAEQAREEIAEVRRLVHGLRPPALDQLGLVSALRQRADEHNLAGDMTWVLDAGDDLGPLPAAVEVAAYRIVVEAVNNAARHSGARTCRVALRRDRDALRIEVRDDGTGIGDAVRPGVGLASMTERARELGGTCTVTSGTAGGTLVAARLPLAATPAADGGDG